MTAFDRAIDALLDEIEAVEARSLRWGYVDGSLDEEAALTLAERVLAQIEADGCPDDLVVALLDRGLLLHVPRRSGGHGYRSRFAEGVRLLARLRQLFPGRRWRAAPALVADFRLDIRRRQYPRRDVSPAAALAVLGLDAPDGEAAALQRRIVEGLLARDGEPLRLSEFQVRAAHRLRAAPPRSTGTVVSAGTGSGKTLAFYLPALAEIGADVRPDRFSVQALALYPRRELLKDQLREVYGIARALDPVLRGACRRSLRLGTFFSWTPREATARALTAADWPAEGAGFACPYLSCPACGGDLLWRREHLERRQALLTCREVRCVGRVDGDHLALTRDDAEERPPDILFTTLESLNQRLSDTKAGKVFGLPREPQLRARFLLLDEIHTYTGMTGAQSALVLRRWQHAHGGPVRIVGLSATLRDAPRFFADLTGLPLDQIEEVRPAADEMEAEGRSYDLVMRGDPAAGTTLLSTSIQAAFLLGRLLDDPARGPSEGRFGSRLFAFTDDLDVVNRFFDDLRDAEGYDRVGRATNRPPLAELRVEGRPEEGARDAEGQVWRTLALSGRDPRERLRVSRTSSQDVGVEASDIVVATSSLEVGFDDPTVGAVLQHKSPLAWANFVQRKGRAGRTRRMRPWMVTVLSDYGRDRVAYQAYEHFFDPELPPQRLPVRNGYLLKMQAVFAFIDWLARRSPAAHLNGWWWQPLNGPPESAWARERQEVAARVCAGLIEGDARLLESLGRHLRGALALTDDELRAVLWEAPRSLLLEAIPTLERRLRTSWRTADGRGHDLFATRRVHPLPDFVPSSLFAELNLPEVAVVTPPVDARSAEKETLMAVGQALRHLAPGRVTRRFAPERGGLSHWSPVALDATCQALPVDAYAPQHHWIADVPVLRDGVVTRVPCFRPWTLRLAEAPRDQVSPNSNATPLWDAEIVPPEGTETLSASRPRAWGALVPEVTFYLHTLRAPLEVRRYATGATATIHHPRRTEELTIETRFVAEGDAPAAVGFVQEADGLRLALSLPDGDELAARAAAAPSLPAWRAAYVRDRVRDDAALVSECSWFQRDWLFEIGFAALVEAADAGGLSLDTAWERLFAERPAERMRRVMEAVFRIRPARDPDADDDGYDDEVSDEPGRTAREARLLRRLSDLTGRAAVLERLRLLLRELWEPDAAAWGAWLRSRLHETLGAGAVAACQALAPEHAETTSLLLDLRRSPDTAPEAALELWVSEESAGGAGVVETIARAFTDDPPSFFAAMDAAFAPSDLELAGVGLERALDLLVDDAEVAATAARVRATEDHAQREPARAAFYAALARRGLTISHALSVGLNARLLRAGMDRTGDELLRETRTRWQDLERRLGVAVDLRVFAYLAAASPDLGPRLAAWIGAAAGTRPGVGETASALAGVLWARPAELRARVLDLFSPYRRVGTTDSALVRELLAIEDIPSVRFGGPRWEEETDVRLAEAGAVRLIAARAEEEALRAALFRLLATPVTVDVLQFYPTLDRIERDDADVCVTLTVQEWRGW